MKKDESIQGEGRSDISKNSRGKEEEEEEKTNIGNNVVLLDLCCGTGTIGIALSSYVSKVIGIEMVETAVEDAKVNAQLNNIQNAEFIAGKVEDVLKSALSILKDQDIVAILDPPRAGVHPSVIKSIRECPLIKRIYFISCDAQAAVQNFVE